MTPVPSGTVVHVLSGTESSCRQERNPGTSPCTASQILAPNNANIESFGFYLTCRPAPIERVGGRYHLRRRRRTLASMAVGLCAVAFGAVVDAVPLLVWNVTPSVPVGLYLIVPARRLRAGDLVAAEPPQALARFLAGRGYVPPDTPLLKRIAAAEGQQVCRTGDRIIIGNVFEGTVLARDRRGRPLPRWQGCRRLGADDVFLMNAHIPDSFDGRYFGPLSTKHILGRAVPLVRPKDRD